MDRSKWEYKKLGEIAKFIGGGTPSKANEDYYTGNIPWATVRDMVDFNLSKTELCITDQAVKESATNIVPKDTIIISTHVGLGKICLLMQDTAINQDLKGVILPQSVDKLFFAAWYKSIADYVISNGKGATVKGVTMKFVNDLKMPVPSIADQQRIVAELDCLNEMIALKQEQLKEFDKLAQSIFYDMFGDPIVNDKGWDIRKLGDCCQNLDSQRRPITAIDRIPGDIPYYGASGIVDYVEGYLFNDDYLLISEDGANLVIRNTPIAFRISGKTWVNNHAHVLKFEHLYEQVYFEFTINLRDVSEYITGCAQPKLTQANLNRLPIPIPPLALQQQFAEKIQAIEEQKELVKQSIAETQQLLDSRMDFYFD